ncbi:tsukushi-like [Anthonomus grandis grandis]|uniref:tsukushi-like n=1 Tax=Anthonomus grandis grandis TaxID=2921223 RepID=UPI00216578E4|nr:tsukushi-like [Anthonomus grandis grandis]
MDEKWTSLKLVFLLAFITIIQGQNENNYDNSTGLCNKCKCISGSDFILDCSYQGFHHMIDDWPEHKTDLIATFSYNNITNLAILPYSDLVRKVVLSHCGIRTLANGAFKDIRMTTYLDLSYNFLTAEEIGPENFKGLYNKTVYEPLMLEHLDLSYNQIHSLPHNFFEHLLSLRELNLEGNRLRVLDPPTQLAMASLKSLQVLNLANNDLTELVGDAVRNLKNLRILNLAVNKLDFVPQTLTLLGDHLEALYLDQNPIFEITDETFLGVKGIITLSLTNMPRLQYVKANSFTPLKNLTILFMSDNPSLTDIDRDAFGPGQALEQLYLHNNSLQDLHYNLTKWSSLRVFTLTGNDLVCDCDLYKISLDLSKDIKENRDGPYCINPSNDQSESIYELGQLACEYGPYTHPSHRMERHFRILKLVLVVTAGVFTITSLVAVGVLYLRYRRYNMNRNYPFVTQVMYNPLRNPSSNFM